MEERQAQLLAWLAYHGVTNKGLAEKLGVHPSMISRIIRGERAPLKRLEELKALGIPHELLPEPSGKPGRPKTSKIKKSLE